MLNSSRVILSFLGSNNKSLLQKCSSLRNFSIATVIPQSNVTGESKDSDFHSNKTEDADKTNYADTGSLSSFSYSHPYKSLFPWKSKQEFVEHLVQQIVH